MVLFLSYMHAHCRSALYIVWSYCQYIIMVGGCIYAKKNVLSCSQIASGELLLAQYACACMYMINFVHPCVKS